MGAATKLMMHVEVGAGETQAQMDITVDETINAKHIGNLMAEITRTAALAIVRSRKLPDHHAGLLYGQISDSYQKNMSVGIITPTGPLLPSKRRK